LPFFFYHFCPWHVIFLRLGTTLGEFYGLWRGKDCFCFKLDGLYLDRICAKVSTSRLPKSGLGWTLKGWGFSQVWDRVGIGKIQNP